MRVLLAVMALLLMLAVGLSALFFGRMEAAERAQWEQDRAFLSDLQAEYERDPGQPRETIGAQGPVSSAEVERLRDENALLEEQVGSLQEQITEMRELILELQAKKVGGEDEDG